MAILAFQKPDKVIMISENNFSGKFEFRPLEPGYGITIGNALRRILISSLEGYSIISVKIDGVGHEFATIPGVIEDVTAIILNLKKVRFKRKVEEFDTEVVNLIVSGTDVFKAGDINKGLSSFEVLNPELEICHLDKKTELKVELTITKGRGYVPAEVNRSFLHPEDIHTIAIDSIFTPIRNVKFEIEDYRIEQKTDFEKLVIEVMTDGSIHPKDALKEAAKILIQHFALFSDEAKMMVETVDADSIEEFDEEVLHMRQMLKRKLGDLNLSVRALNCLKAAEVETLGQLVTHNRNDLLKFRNFGKKSLTELEEILEELNLSFGMDISKYKLDKE